MNNEDGESYEEQTGTVIRVESGRLLVRVDRDDADCGGCRSCAVKALCRGRDSGHMDLPVSFAGAAPAAVGDRVRVAYRSANAAVASLVMFLPSLAGLFFGGFAWQRLAGRTDRNFLLGCLAGFVLGLTVSFAASRKVVRLRLDVKLAPEQKKNKE